MRAADPDAAPRSPVSDVAVGADRSWWSTVRASWPPPRPAVLVVVAPVLMVLILAMAAGSGASPGWVVVAGLVALTGAATLATYVPPRGSGARLDVGCTPCASVAALSVPIAVVVLTGSPRDVPSGLLALGVVGLGLWRRITDPVACPT